jgi:hypothetical protein
MNFALLFLPYSVLCSDLPCDPNYSFPCAKPDPRISSYDNVCLQYLVACDGEQDCLSQDDEVHCDLKSSPDKAEGESKASLCSAPEVNYLWTPCESTPTICIPKSSRCDGIVDCDSGTDEKSCITECTDSCDSSSTCQAIFNETESICKCDKDKSQNLLKEFNPSASLCIEKEEQVQYEIESFVYIKDKTFHEEDENGNKLYTSLFDDEHVRALTFDDNSSLFCFIRITTSDLMCFQKTPGGDHRWALMQFNNFQEFFNLNEIHVSYFLGNKHSASSETIASHESTADLFHRPSMLALSAQFREHRRVPEMHFHQRSKRSRSWPRSTSKFTFYHRPSAYWSSRTLAYHFD